MFTVGKKSRGVVRVRRAVVSFVCVVAGFTSAWSQGAPIVITGLGPGGSTIGVFGPASATHPNTHHGQSFVATGTQYSSIGTEIEEVYGLGTRAFYDPGAIFDLRFQLFEGVGTGGTLLRTIDFDPGAGYDGWLDYDVSGINFVNGDSYTVTFSAAEESGQHLWFGFLADDVYAGGEGIEGGVFRADRDHILRVLETNVSDGVLATVPAPAGLGLLMLGLTMIAGWRRKIG